VRFAHQLVHGMHLTQLHSFYGQQGLLLMTCYVANHRKKKAILKKRELELTKAIKSNIAHEKLALFAREVREAQIRVTNCKRAQIRPTESDDYDKLIHKINQDLEYWVSKSHDEIIDKYKSKTE
jgi:hypothetical protein